VIDDDTFEYKKGVETSVGGFGFEMTFDWHFLSKREDMRRNFDKSAAYRTPTIAGGLFTIERDYFYELGSYDEGYIFLIQFLI
jgi:polypeptide N-acetylgalactosaminyltransferase